MLRLTISFVLILGCSGWVYGQSHLEVLDKVRQIKLLESTRDDVRRILAGLVSTEDNEHLQVYSNEKVSIWVDYADGTCTADPDDDDPSTIWKVRDWTVTRIKVEFEEELTVKDLGIDISRLKQEQMYRESPHLNILHDRSRGIAIETSEDIVNELVFFPSGIHAKKLCTEAKNAIAFYKRDSWFKEKLEDRTSCNLTSLPANVDDVELSQTEIAATTAKTISVTTTATDPENDVLTYNYTISGGRIIGRGSKVVWDLTSIRAGTYTITVGVDDGQGVVGRTVTKTVVVR